MVKLRIFSVAAATLLVLSVFAYSSQDRPLPWHSATISFGPPAEKNFLRVSTNDDDELTELVVHWKGHDLSVPPTEFKSLPDVQLDTVKVLESSDPSYLYLNVSLHFGDDVQDRFPMAWFLFVPGKYDRLMMIKPTSKMTEDYIQKFPGKEPQKEGTSTVIREAPSPKPK
jgi:hypothetical protein